MSLHVGDPRLRQHATQLGRWTRFLGIVGLVGMALYAIFFFAFFGTITASLALVPEASGLLALGAVGIGLVFGVAFLIYAYLSYVMYASGKTLYAARMQLLSNESLRRGFNGIATVLQVTTLMTVALAALGLVMTLVALVS